MSSSSEEAIPGGAAKQSITCPETIEPPKILTPFNVAHWSSSFKQVEDLNEDTASIRHHALRNVREEKIEYDKFKKCYTCGKLEMRPVGRTFDCTCKFHKTKVQENPKRMCSHVLSLKLQLKIWNSQRRAEAKNS